MTNLFIALYRIHFYLYVFIAFMHSLSFLPSLQLLRCKQFAMKYLSIFITILRQIIIKINRKFRDYESHFPLSKEMSNKM